MGVASITRCSMAASMRPGSCSQAALRNGSPGRNITTKSGVLGSWSQYARLPRRATWSRTWRAWSRSIASRCASSRASRASR